MGEWASRRMGGWADGGMGDGQAHFTSGVAIPLIVESRDPSAGRTSTEEMTPTGSFRMFVCGDPDFSSRGPHGWDCLPTKLTYISGFARTQSHPLPEIYYGEAESSAACRKEGPDLR